MPDSRPLRVASLFAGIGGFDLGFERAGADILAQCEIDARCRQLLAERFNTGADDEPAIFDDVTTLTADRLVRGGRPDVIVGGFPCQDVSVAGARAGLDGARSGLWFEYRRLLDEVRPRWCVVENVGGLLSSNDGRDLGTVLGGLADLGYGWAYRVLDAQWFGVPQRRRRIFIVGCLGDAARAAQVLLEPESGGGDPPPRESAREIASALTANGLGGGGPDDNLAQARHVVPVEHQPFGVANTLTRRMHKGINSTVDEGQTPIVTTEVVIPFRKRRRPTANDDDPETWEEADHANTLDAGGNVTRTAHAVLAFNQLQDPVSNEHVSPALGAKSSGMGIAGEWGVRRLTPLECERLQGFPDGWTEGHADSTRYKMLGNAVAVPVIEWIAKRLIAADA